MLNIDCALIVSSRQVSRRQPESRSKSIGVILGRSKSPRELKYRFGKLSFCRSLILKLPDCLIQKRNETRSYQMWVIFGEMFKVPYGFSQSLRCL